MSHSPITSSNASTPRSYSSNQSASSNTPEQPKRSLLNPINLFAGALRGMGQHSGKGAVMEVSKAIEQYLQTPESELGFLLTKAKALRNTNTSLRRGEGTETLVSKSVQLLKERAILSDEEASLISHEILKSDDRKETIELLEKKIKERTGLVRQFMNECEKTMVQEDGSIDVVTRTFADRITKNFCAVPTQNLMDLKDSLTVLKSYIGNPDKKMQNKALLDVFKVLEEAKKDAGNAHLIQCFDMIERLLQVPHLEQRSFSCQPSPQVMTNSLAQFPPLSDGNFSSSQPLLRHISEVPSVSSTATTSTSTVYDTPKNPSPENVGTVPALDLRLINATPSGRDSFSRPNYERMRIRSDNVSFSRTGSLSFDTGTPSGRNSVLKAPQFTMPDSDNIERAFHLINKICDDRMGVLPKAMEKCVKLGLATAKQFIDNVHTSLAKRHITETAKSTTTIEEMCDDEAPSTPPRSSQEIKKEILDVKETFVEKSKKYVTAKFVLHWWCGITSEDEMPMHHILTSLIEKSSRSSFKETLFDYLDETKAIGTVRKELAKLIFRCIGPLFDFYVEEVVNRFEAQLIKEIAKARSRNSIKTDLNTYNTLLDKALLIFKDHLCCLNNANNQLFLEKEKIGSKDKMLEEKLATPPYNNKLQREEIYAKTVHKIVYEFVPDVDLSSGLKRRLSSVGFQSSSLFAPLNPLLKATCAILSFSFQAVVFLPEKILNSFLRWQLARVAIKNAVIPHALNVSLDAIGVNQEGPSILKNFILDRAVDIRKKMNSSKGELKKQNLSLNRENILKEFFNEFITAIDNQISPKKETILESSGAHQQILELVKEAVGVEQGRESSIKYLGRFLDTYFCNEQQFEELFLSVMKASVQGTFSTAPHAFSETNLDNSIRAEIQKISTSLAEQIIHGSFQPNDNLEKKFLGLLEDLESRTNSLLTDLQNVALHRSMDMDLGHLSQIIREYINHEADRIKTLKGDGEIGYAARQEFFQVESNIGDELQILKSKINKAHYLSQLHNKVKGMCGSVDVATIMENHPDFFELNQEILEEYQGDLFPYFQGDPRVNIENLIEEKRLAMLEVIKEQISAFAEPSSPRSSTPGSDKKENHSLLALIQNGKLFDCKNSSLAKQCLGIVKEPLENLSSSALNRRFMEVPMFLSKKYSWEGIAVKFLIEFIR